MKKIAIILICFFLTGCSIVRIDTDNIDNIIGVVLKKEKKLYNRVGKGYKYYVPRGVSYMDTNELNDKLYSNGIYYYLYVDTVSYFHKIEIDYKEDSNLYYSKKIEGKKQGYLEIEQQESLYYVVFNYNYGKIEALVNKDQLMEVILNSSYILSTIQFNDNVIKLSLNDEYFTAKQEQYNKFKVQKKEEYFLEYDDEESEEK